MKTNLLTWMCISVVTLGLAVGGSAAFAKDKGENPSGWTKGEKKGWHGSEVPPGLADKEMKAGKEKEKADLEAKKKQKEAEKEAKKAQKEAEKAQKKVEKEAKKAKKESEKNARKNAEKLGV
ncbi:MAG: hypothetical protein WC133_04705 [Candidatus Omnitrophota bacterium]